MEKVYGVILAGGSGKRLWPLSRNDFPKQLIPFGRSSLLAQSLSRLKAVSFITDTAVVTTQQYVSDIAKIIDDDVKLIIEPAAKNTAAALLLACLELAKSDPNAPLVCTPSDHVIVHQQQFSSALSSAVSYAVQTQKLILIGVHPSYASTAYGYIEYELSNSLHSDVFPISLFHEKPSKETAQKYLAMDAILWNSGIFCAQVHVFIDLFMRHMPELYTQVTEGRYEDIAPVSFDKGVVEKVYDALVVRGNFSWTDVGSLQHFIDSVPHAEHNPVLVDCINVRAYSPNKLIVAYGAENICIVETDDTIVVINTDLVNSMDRVVEHLDKKGYRDYL